MLWTLILFLSSPRLCVSAVKLVCDFLRVLSSCRNLPSSVAKGVGVAFDRYWPIMALKFPSGRSAASRTTWHDSRAGRAAS